MDQNQRDYVVKMAEKYNVPAKYVLAIHQIESSGGENAGYSRAGAYGPFQLMPATAKGLGINIKDPLQNIEGGVKLFGQLLSRFKDPMLAAAAYNAGPTKIVQAGGIPKIVETQDYVRKFANIVGAKNLMDKVAEPVARSAPGQPLTIKLAEPAPYIPNQANPVDTESSFASLLAKIGIGGKKRGKKTPGILDGLF